MKIQNLIIVAIAFVTFFTSCQKDNQTHKAVEQAVAEQTICSKHDHTLKAINTKDAIAKITPIEDATSTKIEEVQTFEKANKQPVELAEPINLRVTKTDQAESRSGSGDIVCNAPMSATTRGRGNYVRTSLYNAFGVSFGFGNMDGGDEMHGFYVTENMTVDFELSGTSTDMSMFLFKGTERCTGRSCSYTLNSLIDYSTSTNRNKDAINNVFLRPGFYLLIIDAPYGRSSDYSLKYRCGGGGVASSICNLFGLDDIDGYYHGDLSEQNCHWSKWNPSATYDATVGGGTDKYIKIKRQSGVANSNQPDLLLNVENGNAIHHIDFKMWIPSNRSASFNVQKKLSYNNASNERGAVFYFYPNGIGSVFVNGRSTIFHYEHDKWLNISLDIHNDFDNFFGLYIDDLFITEFPASYNQYSSRGSNRIAAINFYPNRTDGLFYIDDVSVLD